MIIKIEYCELSARTVNVLLGMKIETLDEASKLTKEDWNSYKFAGKKSWNELQYFLEQKGYTGKVHPFITSPPIPEKKYCFRPKTLRELLETLDEREHIVLTHRFGLYGEEPKKLKELSKLTHVSKDRVSQIQKKALRKLRHPTRAVFFAFLPDDLMEQVFGTTDIDGIVKGLGKTESFTDMKYELLEEMEMKNRRIHELIEKQNDFNANTARKYKEFVEVLQGSELMRFLNEINKMSMRLESQAVNIQATLEIAQKYLGTEVKLPQTQINKFFDDLSMKIVELNELEERFRESVNYKDLILKGSK